MHLLVNMYSLLFVGIFLEPKLGARRLAAVYLTSAILGGITSAWWYPDTVSVGASGAIMGLYGALLALILTRRSTVRTDRRLLVSMGVFVVFNILFGFIAPVGIDNAAHLGGLAGGALMGLLLTPSIEGPNE